MTTLSPVLEQAVALELLILLLVARRSWAMSQGTTYSEARILVSIGLYAFLFVIDLVEDYYLFPLWVLGFDLLLLAAFVPPTALLARSRVQFFPGPNGSWKFKLPIALALLYVGAFLVRTVLTLVYAPQLLELSGAPLTLSGTAYVAVEVVDALFAASTGMMFGRNGAVILARRRLPPGPAASAAAPKLPS